MVNSKSKRDAKKKNKCRFTKKNAYEEAAEGENEDFSDAEEQIDCLLLL